MTDRELFEKALEALEEMGGGYSQNLIAALRERLAQPADANPDPLHLSRILHELAGAASLCWTPHPSGVFDSQEAIKHVESAIAEIRDRLAQQVQEPVAWLVQYSNKHEFVWGQKPQWIADAIGIEPLYTILQPRQWVGLTDDEMHECWDSPLTPLGMKHARMIEAKLRQKNNG